MSVQNLFHIGVQQLSPPVWLAALPFGAGGHCSLEEFDMQFPEANAIVFVEDLPKTLAAALAADVIEDPSRWLADWQADASRLLRRAQHRPGAMLLVDADEARCNPEALAGAVRSRFGADFIPGDHPVPPPPAIDPVSCAVAVALIEACGDARSLLFELGASCVPLGSSVTWAAESALGSVIDPLALVQDLRYSRSGRRRQANTAHGLLAGDTVSVLADREFSAREFEESRRGPTGVDEENTLLLIQLQQMHEELQHCADRCVALEAEVASTLSVAGLVDISIGEVAAGMERDAPPYREHTFMLRGVKAGSRHVAEATVRLVEHHGHPGLVVFGPAYGPALFECWRETGREGDTPYAMLIPSDANSAPLFDAMESVDWSLLHGLLIRIERHMQLRRSPSAERWRQLARRLREQLLEMPQRYRFGSLAIEPVTAGLPGALAFRFGQVICGQRHLAQVIAHWRPQGPHAGLELINDPAVGPPLASWPEDAQGFSPDRLVLAVGAGGGDAKVRAHWARLTDSDREFVGALIAAWPRVAHQVPADLLPAVGSDLSTAAGLALPKAPRLSGGQLLRRIARRLRDSRAAAV